MPKNRPRVLTEIITFQVSPSLSQDIRNQAWLEKKRLGEFLREIVSEGLKRRDADQLDTPTR